MELNCKLFHRFVEHTEDALKRIGERGSSVLETRRLDGSATTPRLVIAPRGVCPEDAQGNRYRSKQGQECHRDPQRRHSSEAVIGYTAVPGELHVGRRAEQFKRRLAQESENGKRG